MKKNTQNGMKIQMFSDEFTILLHRQFIKKSKKLRLSESYAKKIKAIFSILKFDPIPWRNFDIRKIEGGENMYRIRIGKYRIFYSIDKQHRIIKILDIETREKAYE